MKNKISTISILLATLFMIMSCNNSGNKNRETADSAANTGKIMLFNGNFDNWVFVLAEDTVAPETVFTVIDDTIINVKGEPFGYMRTKENYSDYTLHVEYRYPYELTNSGVFVHCQETDNVWPVCYENQLSAGKAGDFVLMNGANLLEADQEKVASGAQFVVITKKEESAENSVGEWNTMEVSCSGDKITTYVNGVLMNEGTGASLTSGHICLQSEGKDIQFKNVYIIEL